MSDSSDPVGWYGRHTAALASASEALDPAMIHAWLLDLLPNAPALVLDVGAGTGRDAAWLAGLGHDVVAVVVRQVETPDRMERAPNLQGAVRAWEGCENSLSGPLPRRPGTPARDQRRAERH